MTTVVNVLLVETDEPALRERTEQLLMDGYAVDAVSHIDQARERLAGRPDALVLSSEPDTIGLLRQVRGGEIPRADCPMPVLVVGVDDDPAAVALLPGGRGSCVAVGPLRTAGDARRRTAPDVHPRRGDARGVGLRTPQAAGPSRTVDSHAHRFAAEARAGRRRVDGADRPRRRLEAHPMTSSPPPDVAGDRRHPCHSVTAVERPRSGLSRSDTHASQQRAGYPQIQSRRPECHVQRAMISVMHEPPKNLLTDCPPDISGYTSAYRCSYTVVYPEAKEVS